MNIFNKCLMGLGGIFVTAIIILVNVDNNQRDFKSQHEYFASQFVSKLANKWRIDDVKEKLSITFLAQTNDINAQRHLSAFSVLGKVKLITNIKLSDYITMLNKSTNVGVFTMDTIFENGSAKVQIVLEEDGDNVKVQALNIETYKTSASNIPVEMPYRSEA